MRTVGTFADVYKQAREYSGRSAVKYSVNENYINRPVSAGQEDFMPRLTKAAALAKAGYVPHKGRPLKWNESTVQISFRLTESQAERLGANRHQSARSIILKYLSGEISDPPTT